MHLYITGGCINVINYFYWVTSTVGWPLFLKFPSYYRALNVNINFNIAKKLLLQFPTIYTLIIRLLYVNYT